MPGKGVLGTRLITETLERSEEVCNTVQTLIGPETLKLIVFKLVTLLDIFTAYNGMDNTKQK